MILLDTNLISELFKPAPDLRAGSWLASQPATMLFSTAVTRGELFYGIRILPEGRRKEALLIGLNELFRTRLAGRVLPFDSEAADAYADILAARRASGRPISQFDAMIAGIARSRGATLATRNVKDFFDCGINIIDPWST